MKAELYKIETGERANLVVLPDGSDLAAWPAPSGHAWRLPINVAVSDEPIHRSQSARVVLSRLTDAEYLALTECPVVAIKRAVEAARIEGVISEADPDFSQFVAGCDALGLISSSRWDSLLAL